MFRQIPVLAFYVLVEAWRSRFALLLALLLLAGSGLGAFLGQVAITETGAVQASLLAALLRLSTVFLLSLFCVSSLVREFAEKGIYLLLSLPLPRPVYLLGKFVGFAALSLFVAALCGTFLLFYAPPLAVLWWSVSLWCELLIMVLVSMLCAIGLNHATPAFSMVLGFYLLSRVMGAIQQMAASTWYNTQTLADRFIEGFIGLLGFLLPNLEQFTDSAWLIYPPANAAFLWPVLAQTLIYLALLGAMNAFDLYRKNL
jgi:hypothetical protein